MPFVSGDTGLLHQTFTDPFVRQYLWDNEIIPRETCLDILEKNDAYFRDSRWGLWKILAGPDRNYMGFAGLWYFFDEAQPQLLYGLLPQYAGKGYATEAARAVADYAFGRLRFPYLQATCDTPHAASKKVCERLACGSRRKKKQKGK